tara:strand:+ start:8261 stop:8866 length:606 start_codon:yes stop_codon:yes gene_type:complete
MYYTDMKKKTYSSIDQKRKIVFVHNPKVAGTSIRKMLGMEGSITHLTPDLLVNKKTWEEYFVVVAVREPIERFISSYNYHTSDNYKGHYSEKYPDLSDWSIQRYFETFKNEPFGIINQVNYLRHPLSEKEPDFIIRFEKLAEDIQKLIALREDLDDDFPFLNKSNKKMDLSILKEDKAFMKKLIAFYEEDYRELNYSPPKV